MPMTREEAIRLAQYMAHNSPEMLAYLPHTPEEAAEFKPHEWVIDAIIEASRNEY